MYSKHVHKRFSPCFFFHFLFIMRASHIRTMSCFMLVIRLRVILSEHAKHDICSVQCTSRLHWICLCTTDWWPIIYDYYTQNKYCGARKRKIYTVVALAGSWRGESTNKIQRWLYRWFRSVIYHMHRIVILPGFPFIEDLFVGQRLVLSFSCFQTAANIFFWLALTLIFRCSTLICLTLWRQSKTFNI